MMVSPIDVGDLFLRAYTADDFEEFAGLMGDPDVMQHADGMLSAARVASLFRTLTESPPGQEVRAWAVIDRPSQGLAGHAVLKRSADQAEQNLNILLRPRFRQKGNGTAIGSALIDIAFQDAGCAAVAATVDRDHTAALALAKALGMLPIALERDTLGDYIVLKIYRDRWRARK